MCNGSEWRPKLPRRGRVNLVDQVDLVRLPGSSRVIVAGADSEAAELLRAPRNDLGQLIPLQKDPLECRAG